MEWNQLIAPPARDFHSEETAAIREELAAEVAGILEARQKFDAHYDGLKSQPVEDVDREAVFQVDIPQSARFEILQGELRVRNRIAEFYPREDGERMAAHTAAFEAHQKKSADIRKKLLRMGYRELIPGGSERGTFQPGWIMNHPEVRDAKDRMDELRTADRDLANENADCTAELLKELSGLRQRALVG